MFALFLLLTTQNSPKTPDSQLFLKKIWKFHAVTRILESKIKEKKTSVFENSFDAYSFTRTRPEQFLSIAHSRCRSPVAHPNFQLSPSKEPSFSRSLSGELPLSLIKISDLSFSQQSISLDRLTQEGPSTFIIIPGLFGVTTS